MSQYLVLMSTLCLFAISHLMAQVNQIKNNTIEGKLWTYGMGMPHQKAPRNSLL